MLHKIITSSLIAAMLFTVTACTKSTNTSIGNSQNAANERVDVPIITLPPKTPDAAEIVSPTPITTEAAEQKKVTAVTDFSFLADKTGTFPDVTQEGTWFPGKTQRNFSTGEVTYVWERDEATIDLIKQYGGIYRGDESKKICYLTFDCGYEYKTAEYADGVTAAILDTLKAKNIKAIFFVTGTYIQESPETVKRMLAEGHIVGNHTMNHKNPTQITPSEFVEDIMENERALKAIIPTAPDMIYYRAPQGAANEKTLALAQKMGLTTVFWSACLYDYDIENQPSTDEALTKYKERLHNGCVYLLHAISVTNAKILPELIDFIQSQGFEIDLL